MAAKARLGAGLVMVCFLVMVGIGFVPEARAHCDAMDGPVVKEAMQAIKAGDVTPVLKWVRSEDEAAVKAALQQTLKVRTKGPEARDLADKSFFETLVRLHRASEGAPYTGLKPAGTDPGPGVRDADRALETGSVEALVRMLTDEAAAGLRRRFAAALEKQKHAAHNTPAGREFGRAYVEFVHYVEALHVAVAGAHPAPPGPAATGGGQHHHD